MSEREMSGSELSRGKYQVGIYFGREMLGEELPGEELPGGELSLWGSCPGGNCLEGIDPGRIYVEPLYETKIFC